MSVSGRVSGMTPSVGWAGIAIPLYGCTLGWIGFRGLFLFVPSIGDEPTWTQVAAVVSRVFGRPALYQSKPETQEPLLEAIRKVAAFLEQDGDSADIASLRQLHPQLLTFEAWLRQQALRGEMATA